MVDEELHLSDAEFEDLEDEEQDYDDGDFEEDLSDNDEEELIPFFFFLKAVFSIGANEIKKLEILLFLFTF